MPSLIRSASLNNYVEVARAVGLDPYAMLRRAGLERSCLLDPDTMIPAEAVRDLLEMSASSARIEDFGLRLAESRQLSNLGPISLAIRDEPTLRGALQSMARYLRLHNEALFVSVEEADGIVVIREELLIGGSAPTRQSVELAVGAMFRMLRELLGNDWEPRSICFTHPAPASLIRHLRLFGRFVDFSRDFNGLVCGARDLESHIRHADPVMARYARQYVDTMLALPNLTMSDKVRQLVPVLLPSGRCSVEQVARHIGVDRRTVHRQLAAGGGSFSSILGAVRAELAARYIETRSRPLSEVAELLGFSAQSAFARWFRGRFGCSASAWRAARAPLRST